MPNLNLNFQVLIFEDSADRNPQIRLPDLSKSIQGIPVTYDKSDRILLNPGDIDNIAVTTRAILWDTTTQLSISRPVALNDNIRVTWTGTGTNPIFRTNRNMGGDATTTVSITRVSPYTARLQQVAGTAFTLGGVVIGDFVRFEPNTDLLTSPFSAANVGTTLQIQAVGSNYIDFIDNGQASLDTNIVLGASYSQVLKVISPGPVKVGDTIELTGSNINLSNQGNYTITDVSDSWVQFINPFAYPQTVLYDTNLASFTIYQYLIGFVLARGIGGPFQVKFGNQTQWVTVDMLGDTAIFLGSVSTYQIQATNPGPNPVEISIQYAKVNS